MTWATSEVQWQCFYGQPSMFAQLKTTASPNRLTQGEGNLAGQILLLNPYHLCLVSSYIWSTKSTFNLGLLQSMKASVSTESYLSSSIKPQVVDLSFFFPTRHTGRQHTTTVHCNQLGPPLPRCLVHSGRGMEFGSSERFLLLLPVPGPPLSSLTHPSHRE